MSAATNVFLPGAEEKESAANYNFKHFRSKHLLLDAWATISGKGVQPGEPGPISPCLLSVAVLLL